MDGSGNQAPAVRRPRHRALLVIGAFKLAKATLLTALGVWALRLVHSDMAGHAARWIEKLHLDPGNHYVAAAMAKISGLDDHRLKEIGAISFFYAALFCAEGVGLCLRKRWGEYMTIVLTASGIPLEILGIVDRPTAVRGVLLLANAAILAYLLRIVYSDRRRAAEPADDAQLPSQ